MEESLKSTTTILFATKWSCLRLRIVLQVAGAMLDEGFMAEARAETMKQEREAVCVAMQYAASFHCLVEEWKYCEELKPKPKEKWLFVGKKE